MNFFKISVFEVQDNLNILRTVHENSNPKKIEFIVKNKTHYKLVF